MVQDKTLYSIYSWSALGLTLITIGVFAAVGHRVKDQPNNHFAKTMVLLNLFSLIADVFEVSILFFAYPDFSP